MRQQFGAHWLMSLGILKPGQGKLLMKAVSDAKAEKASIFEIICGVLNLMPPEETADAIIAGGMEEVSMCRFFPSDGDCNPILDNKLKNSSPSIIAVQDDFATIRVLQDRGIVVNHYVGPSCFKIGHDYSRMREIDFINNAISFYKELKDDFEELGVTPALEYLRPSEDVGALMGLDRVRRICEADELGGLVKWHADRFHMQEREKDPATELRRGGDLLSYFHAHGTNRGVAGSENLDGDPSATDYTDWNDIRRALYYIGYIGPVVPEPFGQQIRDIAPELGEGLPPSIEPNRYLRLTHACFKKARMV
ncbi:MAG: sugar phosphate isomerase/epimerase [Candidatus Paceibacteria bacterium]|jgi:sugar phosphate isomerase/epimerase